LESIQLEKVLSRIDFCCSDTVHLIHANGKEIDVFKTCNNRACSNPDCMVHRGILHEKNHYQQLAFVKKYIQSPKSFVFTGWRLSDSVDEVRDFARKKLMYLVFVLDTMNRLKVSRGVRPSPYVVFMEFKLYRDGSRYLHFHVISGSIGDIHLVQRYWHRIVRYEHPIVDDDQLIKYVRKYTGKVPVVYQSDSGSGTVKLQDDFGLYVDYIRLSYKLQMCRYSESRRLAILEFGKFAGSWYRYEDVMFDYLCGLHHFRESEHTFIPYLDVDHPPDSDVPACVYVYPESSGKVAHSSKCGWNKKLEDFL
jgi:hypothetical protein